MNNRDGCATKPARIIGVCVGLAMLAGCSALSNLTNPDGTAINPGPVCVDTANGRFCYTPTAIPGTAAVAPAPVVQAVPPPIDYSKYPKTLEK